MVTRASRFMKELHESREISVKISFKLVIRGRHPLDTPNLQSSRREGA